MRVDVDVDVAEADISGEGILSEYCWIMATVSRDSWSSFWDKMSMEV